MRRSSSNHRLILASKMPSQFADDEIYRLVSDSEVVPNFKDRGHLLKLDNSSSSC